MLNIFFILIFTLAGVNDILWRFSFFSFIQNIPSLSLITEALFVFYAFLRILNYKKNIKFTLLEILFFLGFLISIFSGFINSTFSLYSIMTFYIFLMPIIMMRFGRLIYQSYDDVRDFELKLKKPMKIIFSIIIVQSILFILLFKLGYIGRIGNSISLFLPILYFIIYSRKKIFLFLAPLAIILQGKRTSIISIFLISIDIFLRRRLVTFRKISIYPLYFIFFFAFIYLFFYEQISLYLSRWSIGLDLINQIDITSALDVISSGRVEQALSAIYLLNDSLYNQLFGSGSGTILTYVISEENAWYVHNSYLTYAIQCGYILPTFYILLVIRKILNYRKLLGRQNTFAYLYILCFLPGIIFSSNLNINPLFWFFIGSLSVRPFPFLNNS